MRKKPGQADGVPTLRKAWNCRLIDLGLNPKEWGYSDHSPDNGPFFKGDTVFVLIDARTHLGLGPVMTFWPAHADLRGLLKCMAILE